MPDKSSNTENPIRARRWTPPPVTRPAASSKFRSYRFMFRLIGIPAVAVAGVFIYQGLSDRLVLPECDSNRAKHTLEGVLKQLKLEPTKYAPLKTLSSTKNDVVCSAVMPLPEGGIRFCRLYVLLAGQQFQHEIHGVKESHRQFRRCTAGTIGASGFFRDLISGEEYHNCDAHTALDLLIAWSRRKVKNDRLE